MSLQTSSKYFFFLFLLTLISCQDPNDIGLNLQNGKQLGTAFDNKQTVEAATVVQPDSILAFKSNPIVVGKVSDGDFGTINASHYSEVLLNGNNLNLNDNAGAQADSLVLVLAYTGYFYGDTTQEISLDVRRLTESFKTDQTYFTSTKPVTAVDQMPLLANIKFKPRYHRVSRNGGTFSRLIRIRLNDAFANELLQKSNTSDFNSQETFQAYWKGVVITPANTSKAGSVIGLNTLPDSSGTLLGRVAGINLYFKDKSGKAVFHNFGLSGTNYYNGNAVNRTGTQLAVLDQQPTKTLPAVQAGNKTFLQTNTGVRTIVTFPGLSNFKESRGNVFINHAELVFPVAKNATPGEVLPAPSAIYLYENTNNNRVLKTSGGTAIAVQRGDAPAFGITRPNRVAYNADSSFYKADITSYVQAVVDQKKTTNGIMVTAAPLDAFTAAAVGVSFPETATLNRAIFNTTGNRPIQLRIYYSLLK